MQNVKGFFSDKKLSTPLKCQLEYDSEYQLTINLSYLQPYS